MNFTKNQAIAIKSINGEEIISSEKANIVSIGSKFITVSVPSRNQKLKFHKETLICSECSAWKL